VKQQIKQCKFRALHHFTHPFQVASSKWGWGGDFELVAITADSMWRAAASGPERRADASPNCKTNQECR